MVGDDAKWFSESVLGQATEVAQSSNVQRGRFHVTTDRNGVSQSETKRALLTPDEVMNIREDELLMTMPPGPLPVPHRGARGVGYCHTSTPLLSTFNVVPDQ